MDIKSNLEALRKSKVFTNYYLPDNTICSDKKMSLLYKNECSIVFQKETDYSFSQIFVFTTENISETNIKKSVFEFVRDRNSLLNNEKLHQWASSNNFVHYKTFNRMALMRTKIEALENEIIETPKNEADLLEVKQFLEENFDIFAERIPTINELDLLKNTTYIIKDDSQIVALLIAEKKGVTEELRYWLVKSNYRKKKYGALLMKYFLNKFEDTKRFILWVDNQNENAINIYQHYGFQQDRILNEIYLTKDLL